MTSRILWRSVCACVASATSTLVIVDGAYEAAPGSDVRAFYSNYGGATDLAAPGGDCRPGYPATCVDEYFILSTYIIEDGPYAGLPACAWFIGASMATPHVAAVAAVVKVLHPDWTPGAIRAFLKATAEPIGPHQQFGHGLVSADNISK